MGVEVEVRYNGLEVIQNAKYLSNSNKLNVRYFSLVFMFGKVIFSLSLEVKFNYVKEHRDYVSKNLSL